MTRNILERELKAVGISLNGWMPVLQCDVCGHQWEPFPKTADLANATVRFDYWKCSRNCNANAQLDQAIVTALPRYVEINGVPGMVFDDDDLREFERYVRSMDATQVPNK
jgi:hypothetical protein